MDRLTVVVTVSALGCGRLHFDPIGTTAIYAHTPTALLQFVPDTGELVEIGSFGMSDQMTDLAIDRRGRMIGVSFTGVYQIDPSSGAAVNLATHPELKLNGLSFVPASVLDRSGDEVLIATVTNGTEVLELDPDTGSAVVVGDLGTSESSGDLVWAESVGILQTLRGGASDQLARLAVRTFSPTPIGSVGFQNVYGIAFWAGGVYGFVGNGEVISIDSETGAGTLILQTNHLWAGAAVSTSPAD